MTETCLIKVPAIPEYSIYRIVYRVLLFITYYFRPKLKGLLVSMHFLFLNLQCDIRSTYYKFSVFHSWLILLDVFQIHQVRAPEGALKVLILQT